MSYKLVMMINFAEFLGQKSYTYVDLYENKPKITINDLGKWIVQEVARINLKYKHKWDEFQIHVRTLDLQRIGNAIYGRRKFDKKVEKEMEVQSKDDYT